MLKQLKLQLEMKEKREQLASLKRQKEEFQRRSAELETALNEAQTTEDFETLKLSVEALEKESAESDLEEQIHLTEESLSDMERQLHDITSRKQAVEQGHKKTVEKNEKRGEIMNKFQVRELMKSGQYYELAEVREFYDGFRNLRAVGGSELLVPQIIVNRIMDIVGDYCTLYPLVDKITAGGTVRILIDTDTTAATWMEMNATIPTGDVGTITHVDFDGFKVGKVTFVDNSILKDSMINLDDYVTRKIARALALALDKAILKGEGAAQKQPEGILSKLPAANKVTVKNPQGYAEIVQPIGKIDTGEDSVGEIIAVMKRQTYYNKILPYSVQPTATGNVVGKLPNLGQPDLLGLRVVFNNYMEEDQILFGDFGKYTLIERESISIDSSEHVKFSEDQMAFRGKARFDGKPVNPKAFVLVTLSETAPTS